MQALITQIARKREIINMLSVENDVLMGNELIIGFKNDGVSCYVNSVLQIFLADNFLQKNISTIDVQSLYDYQKQIVHELKKLVYHNVSFSPQILFYAIIISYIIDEKNRDRKYAECFNNMNYIEPCNIPKAQEDAASFMNNMLDIITNGKKFSYNMINIVKDEKHPHEVHIYSSKENDSYLTIGINENIEDLYKKHGYNQIHINTIIENQDALLLNDETNFGQNLFVSFARVKYTTITDGTGKPVGHMKEKLTYSVIFPNNLIVDFGNIGKINDEFKYKNNFKYKLIAFNVHYGVVDGGHYTACRMINDEYYNFNDDAISVITNADFLNLAKEIVVAHFVRI